jgi:hypothetical protein
MTVISKCLVEATQLPAAQTDIYPCPENTRTSIDKFTATNVSAAAVTLTVNIVANGGAVGSSNVITKVKTLAINETYGFPELVGQILNTGDFISVLASAATAINVRVSGRETT